MLNRELGLKAANLMKSKERKNLFMWPLDRMMRIASGRMIEFFINCSTRRMRQAANAIALKRLCREAPHIRVKPVGTDHQIEFTCAVVLERDPAAAGRLSPSARVPIGLSARSRLMPIMPPASAAAPRPRPTSIWDGSMPAV